MSKETKSNDVFIVWKRQIVFTTFFFFSNVITVVRIDGKNDTDNKSNEKNQKKKKFLFKHYDNRIRYFRRFWQL